MPINNSPSFSLHPLINPDQSLARPAFCKMNIDHLEVTQNEWMKKLIAYFKKNIPAANLKQDLARHLGSSVTYTHIDILKKYLCIISAAIDDKIPDLKLTADEKLNMAETLHVDIRKCTPGFMDRVKAVILSLNVPQNMDELLAHYRIQLVERAAQNAKTARDDGLEVHTRQAYFTFANMLGLGIPDDNVKDPAGGYDSAQAMTKTLQAVFLESYTPAKLVAGIWQTVVHAFGYRGYQADASYPLGVYGKVHDYFRKVLNKPALTLHECFIIDDDDDAPRVHGINWKKIDTFLIDMLETEGYVFSHENSDANLLSCLYVRGDHELEVIYSPDDFANARINYTYKDKSGNVIRECSYLGVVHDDHAPNADTVRDALIADLMADTINLFAADTESDYAKLLPVIHLYDEEQRADIVQKIFNEVASLDDLCERVVSLKLYISNISHAENFKNKFDEYIKNLDDFHYFLDSVDGRFGEDAVTNILWTYAVQFIRTHEDLIDLIERATNSATISLLTRLKSKLPAVVRTAEELSKVLDSLEDEARVVIIDMLAPHISGNIVQSLSEAELLLQSIDDEELRKKVFSLLINYLLSIAHNANDYNILLKQADNKFIGEFYITHNEKLQEIGSQSLRDFKKIVSCFKNDEMSYDFYLKTRDKLLPLIASIEDVFSIIDSVPAANRKAIFKDLNDSICSFMKSSYKMERIYTGASQRGLCLTELSGFYRSFVNAIKSNDDFRQFFNLINVNNRFKIYKHLFDNFPQGRKKNLAEEFHRFYDLRYRQTWTPSFFGNPNQSDYIKAKFPPNEQWEQIMKQASENIWGMMAQSLEDVYFRCRKPARHHENQIVDLPAAKRRRA